MDLESVRERNRRNIILTGPPRSGTTLTCWLLNKVPNTLALHEPIRPFGFVNPRADAETILDAMGRFFHRQRRTVREKGSAQSKHVGGHVPTDPYDSFKSGRDEIRYQRVKEGVEFGEIEVDTGTLKAGFYLVIKDPAMLSALLGVLVERFPCYAVIRNPLSILASWDTVNHHARNGHSPAAERYDENLREELAAIPDRRARQLRLLDWWFGRFAQALESDHVIRYEEIIASGGSALGAIVPEAYDLYEPLDSRNLNALYNRDRTLALGERLLGSEGTYWSFYSRREVENLLARMEKAAYHRGYADAAMGKAACVLVGPADGQSSVREELDYHAGYTDAIRDFDEGCYDPAHVAERYGWVPPQGDLLPFAERRRSARVNDYEYGC